MNDTVVESGINIEEIRAQFPILQRKVNGKPLIYFDNAATNQKPQRVIDALINYYSGYNANVHRGIHTLAEEATTAFEQTRESIQQFVNARESEEITYTKGTTDSINLIAATYGRKFLKEGDEIVISAMEHHSNIVPWHMLCEEKGAILKVIPVDDAGDIIFEEYEKLLSEKTKIVSMVHVSNTLGTINPIAEVTELAHRHGAIMIVDGAQASSHIEVDVQKLDIDFYAGSAHKFYGPTGMGFLYGKRELLESMPPYQGGGEMIKEVTYEKTTYNDIPYKFEAGTPNIADVIATNEAIQFVNELGKENIGAHEDDLLEYGMKQLQEIDIFKPIGTAKKKVSVISFILEGIHHFDAGVMLDAKGVAVRTGHHCTQPLMGCFGIDGTIRASFSVYNTREEIDVLVEGIKSLRKLRG